MKLLFVSTFPPTKCGIATYTSHLREGMMRSLPLSPAELPVLSVFPDAWTPSGPEIWPLPKHDPDAYLRAADAVNASDVDVVSLQHEFGIFGGEAGRMIIPFLERLKKPVITTLHTVFDRPTPPYSDVLGDIVRLSTRLVVMNRLGIEWITRQYPVSPRAVRYLPHGAPAPLEAPAEALKAKWGVAGRKVVLTFGLLSPGKGIDRFLPAFARVVADVPDAVYIIAGQTHPEVKKAEGEAYRESLVALAERLGIAEHVLLIDRFLDEPELVELLSLADVYVTPYPGLGQITSGTLAYAVGLGRPTLSTPYAYARDLLRNFPDLLVPYGDEAAWAERLGRLLRDDAAREALAARLKAVGAGMRWPRVGARFYALASEIAGRKERIASHG
ncbi:MAG: glycosyltransferase family 4 protein [Hydrogenibacillus schlegelii]|uniref:Glycosyltransferase family 4 protein n=1 Tax=Hydrogenibacillus schlegelii TaxID=1484 RepID=A0A947CUL7_HYDSH|nr:glycosyltransferase family 4 protein [Hydrogenibacillus schlegelii]